jgi:hypothetical protein
VVTLGGESRCDHQHPPRTHCRWSTLGLRSTEPARRQVPDRVRTVETLVTTAVVVIAVLAAGLACLL